MIGSGGKILFYLKLNCIPRIMRSVMRTGTTKMDGWIQNKSFIYFIEHLHRGRGRWRGTGSQADSALSTKPHPGLDLKTLIS